MGAAISKAVTGVVIATCLMGCVTGSATRSAGDADRIRQQADAWDQAIIRKEAKAVADNMAEDFIQIGSDGLISDKPTFLKAILSPDLVIHPYTVQDYRLRIYGDTALINGRTDMTGSYKGKAFRTHYRYTDTYVKRDGIWRVVNVQTTEVGQ